MNVLLIGSGGREHALAWAMSASPLLGKLYCAPGNAGIAEVAECVALDVADHAAVVALLPRQRDRLGGGGPRGAAGGRPRRRSRRRRDQGLRPLQGGGATRGLEGLHQGPVPRVLDSHGRLRPLHRCARPPRPIWRRRSCPSSSRPTAWRPARAWSSPRPRPTPRRPIDACFAGAFGAAGAEVVIEEFLEGEEASFFALVDGEHVLPLATAQDHKRVGDGDTGPNTGGMGAYSPAPVMTPEMTRRVMDEIIRPDRARHGGTRHALQGRALSRRHDHQGWPQALRVQRALRRSGVPGADDAPQVGPAGGAARHRRRRARDLRPALARRAGAHRRHGRQGLSRRLRATARRSAASMRPAPCRASRSSTPARAARATGCSPPAAACSTSRRAARRSAEAKQRAYEAIAKIDWPGGFYRTDIGWRAIAREKARAMNVIADLFPGFAEQRIKTDGAEIFLRTGGAGPPLLLLHGYPQTHVVLAQGRARAGAALHAGDPRPARLWRQLRARRRCRARDLFQARHGRRTACEVMRALGHERFIVAGHDRGGRVAYRLALDHPEAVARAHPDRHRADGRGVAAHHGRAGDQAPITGRSWRSPIRCPRR